MEVAWGLVGLGAAAFAFALLLGGRDERIFVAAKAATVLARVFIRIDSPAETLIRDAALDLALFVVVLLLALRSDKVWPLAAASLCLASLMTVGAQALVQATPQAYAIVGGAWELLTAAVVAAGAWRARSAQKSEMDSPPLLRSSRPKPGAKLK